MIELIHHYQRQVYAQNVPAKLFDKTPLLSFRPTQETCPVDVQPLHVLNTKTRTIKAIGIGAFRARHTTLYCPMHPELGSWKSTDLPRIVPPDSNVSYSVIVEIGRLRFLESRQVAEIQLILLERHCIDISASEIEHLIDRFIFYLAAVHQESNQLIKEYIKMQGGYILHIDATCEGDSPKLILSLDAVSGFVLYSVKAKSENTDDLVGFLTEIRERIGFPHAVVSDMGKGIKNAVKSVFGDILHFICHFHFLKVIGLMLFEKENTTLRNALSKAAISGDLKAMRAKLGKNFDELPINGIENFLVEPERFGKTAIASEITTYYLILSILDHGAEGDGYGFPFDQRYLNFYQRLKDAYTMIEEVTPRYSHDSQNDRAVWKLYHTIRGVVEDRSLRKTVEQYQAKLEVFSDLREAFGTTPRSVNNGLTQTKELTSLREHQKIKNAVKSFLNTLQKKNKREKDKKLAGLCNRVINKIEEYGERLFPDPLVVVLEDGKRTFFIHRTNNIVEQLFRWLNYGFRRIHGNHSVRRNLENIPEQLPLVENLKNPEYMKLVFGGEVKMAEAFSGIDVKIVREMERNHYPKKKIHSSRKIKKALRSPDFREQLLSAFQAVTE
ncbi:MAG: transposase [Desulfobulbaceae bacterium]|uniref:Transposase n=1 Tax=Candidatus Desulfobia pelagia TaxID=2841692 RepID=A0A8J6TEY7_9BACT|nr:transposase [Candidatus Desulfobia pelagia]